MKIYADEGLNSPLFALAFRYLAAGLSFCFSLLTARLLGVKTFGIFQVILGLINIGVVVSLLGHEALATRRTALFSVNGDIFSRKEFGDYLSQVRKLVFVAAIGISIGLSSILFVVPFGDNIVIQFWALFLLVFLIARARLAQAFIRGAHQSALAIVPDGIIRPGLATAVFLVFGYYFTEVPRPVIITLVVAGVIGAASIATLVAKVIERKALGELLRDGIGNEPDQFPKRSSVLSSNQGFSWPIFLSSILTVLTIQVAVVGTGFFAGAKVAGLYAGAERFAMAASLIAQAVYQARSSKIAALYEKMEMASLRKDLRGITRNTFLMTLLVCAAMFILSKPLLGLYGAEFTSGDVVLKILLIGVLVNAAAGPLGILLLMTHNEKYYLLSLFITVTFQFMAIPLMVYMLGGVIGVAVAMVLAVMLRNILMSVYIKKHIGVCPLLAWA